MNQAGVLSLPPEILHGILTSVYGNSFRDLCRARASCRTLDSVATDPFFYRDVDLFNMHVPNRYLNGVRTFKLRCLQNRNPSALFIKGSHLIFRLGRFDEGLAMIRESAQAGYDLSVYAYANLCKIMFPENDLGVGFLIPDRDVIRRARERLEFTDVRAWDYRVPDFFIERSQMIDVGVLYNCRCAPYQAWEDPSNEMFKPPSMCESCFWTIQKLWFSKKFPRKVARWPQ